MLPLSAGFLFDLFFDIEDGSDVLLQNIDPSLHYTALETRRPHSSLLLPYEPQIQNETNFVKDENGTLLSVSYSILIRKITSVSSYMFVELIILGRLKYVYLGH